MVFTVCDFESDISALQTSFGVEVMSEREHFARLRYIFSLSPEQNVISLDKLVFFQAQN